MSASQMETWAEALLVLVERSARMQDLAVGQDEARAVGEEVFTAGGFSLMKEVAHRTRDLGRHRGQPFALGYVERWWNGIGPWQA